MTIAGKLNVLTSCVRCLYPQRSCRRGPNKLSYITARSAPKAGRILVAEGGQSEWNCLLMGVSVGTLYPTRTYRKRVNGHGGHGSKWCSLDSNLLFQMFCVAILIPSHKVRPSLRCRGLDRDRLSMLGQFPKHAAFDHPGSMELGPSRNKFSS